MYYSTVKSNSQYLICFLTIVYLLDFTTYYLYINLKLIVFQKLYLIILSNLELALIRSFFYLVVPIYCVNKYPVD
ncbi:hypothetical protein AHMF7605_05790 [Adhaeribacter arboris]|uniref:Uncharacterized protein n=1 Tax=Adhaeribacter arboris TaxID=2072846 RepID=A0A2T2YC23_9BACT|nr:hypothetical protein AHMF7605_05790 [Adhaeribacter arboris]